MFVLQEAAAAKEKSQRDNKSFFRNLKVKLNKGNRASTCISISRLSMVSSDTSVVRTLCLLYHQRLVKQWALARAL